MNANELWKLSPKQFNEWRSQNDYPILLNLFIEKLPDFRKWMENQKLSPDIIFQHGLARFVCTEEPVSLCKYKNDGHLHLFDKSLKQLPSIRKSGWIEDEQEYQPYFYWLKKNFGKEVFEKTKREFMITGWHGGKPQFMRSHFLLYLGNTEVSAPILSGRLLDFTCLDNLKFIGAINNSSVYLWYCSTIGLTISGGLAFLNFYKSRTWQHGYGQEKRELVLTDGIFQDLHFSECELRIHAIRSTLHLCSISGVNFDISLQYSNLESTRFTASSPAKQNYLQRMEFYNKAKILYSSIGKRAEAGEYFFKEKINCMLSLLTPKKIYKGAWNRKNWFFKSLFIIICYFKFIFRFINYAVWGFGERPFRCMITSIIVIIISAFVYYFNLCSVTYGDSLKSLYFSMVTFVTIGSGDILQKDFNLQLYSSLEALLGMLLLGLFLAGYVSKSKEY